MYEQTRLVGEAEDWVNPCVILVSLNSSPNDQLSVLGLMVALLYEFFKTVVFDILSINVSEFYVVVRPLCIRIEEVFFQQTSFFLA